MSIQDRLNELGITLPKVTPPVGAYVPALTCGDLVMTSGQLPILDGKLVWKGKVPIDVTLESAQQAARQAALNALAAVAGEIGELDRIRRIVRVCVYVNSGPGFTDQPKVANGASELFGQIFGDTGRHVRSAIGVNELPLDAAVELELMAQVG